MKKRGLSGQSLNSIEPLVQGPSWQHHFTADGTLASISMSLPITGGSWNKNLKETLLSGLLSFPFYTTQDCPCRGKGKKHIHRKRYLGQVVTIALQMVSYPEKDM